LQRHVRRVSAETCRLPGTIEGEGTCFEEVNTLPLYPYRCTQCGHRFEKIQSFSAEPVKVCPNCGGAVERVLTAPGLQFKGAGWYVNDYSSKSSSSSDSSSSETKAPAKTDGAAASSSSTAAPEAPASAPAASSESTGSTKS
jgi:putative FmdB family regulatory protein